MKIIFREIVSISGYEIDSKLWEYTIFEGPALSELTYKKSKNPLKYITLLNFG